LRLRAGKSGDFHNPIEYREQANKPRSWYLYYVGANGLSLFNFSPTAFQNLLYQKAGDGEILHFLGSDRTINSIVLLSNGISFAIQIVLFLILGSYADFGTFRSPILLGLSIVAYAIGFAWLGVHNPDQWKIGTGLYIVGLLAYQLTLSFWSANFPVLARNTRELREKAKACADGTITQEEYDHADSMKRNELSNVSRTRNSHVFYRSLVSF
jgi:MFS-type transporter involved in bile tolerance (Atg22 family)